jgi:hypothetical protein
MASNVILRHERENNIEGRHDLAVKDVLTLPSAEESTSSLSYKMTIFLSLFCSLVQFTFAAV